MNSQHSLVRFPSPAHPVSPGDDITSLAAHSGIRPAWPACSNEEVYVRNQQDLPGQPPAAVATGCGSSSASTRGTARAVRTVLAVPVIRLMLFRLPPERGRRRLCAPAHVLAEAVCPCPRSCGGCVPLPTFLRRQGDTGPVSRPW